MSLTFVDQFTSRLAELPRAPLGLVVSPVEHWVLEGTRLLVKRDDLNAPMLGGNKARALAFLLGDLPPGREIVTVGGVGSTHVLATAVHAAALGHSTRAYRWPHEENACAARVAREITTRCRLAPVCASPARAFAAASWSRIAERTWWIPFGGTSSRGIAGHVEGALELARQVGRGDLPEPARVFVAHGTGGTAAGLALGFEVAGLRSRVVAVRCGPGLRHERQWGRWLIHRAARWLGLDRRVIRGAWDRVLVTDDAWSGAYGRPHEGAEALARSVREMQGVVLDDTYAAKACYAALRAQARTTEPVLFWQTFDARWMAHGS